MTRAEFRRTLTASLESNNLRALHVAICRTNNGVTLRKDTDTWTAPENEPTVNEMIKARAFDRDTRSLHTGHLDDLATWLTRRIERANA